MTPPGEDDDSNLEGHLIAAQGPSTNGDPAELGSFLALLVDHNVNTVVSMDRSNDYAYWPAPGATQQVVFGDRTLSMTTEHVEQRDGFDIVTIRLQDPGSEVNRLVSIYSYNQWPDEGVPQGAQAMRQLADFARAVDAASNGSEGNNVVHCADGAGRTGTYILLSTVVDSIWEGLLTRDDLLDFVIRSVWDCRVSRGPDFVSNPGQLQLILDVALAEMQRAEAAGVYRNDSSRSSSPAPGAYAGAQQPGNPQQPANPQQPGGPQQPADSQQQGPVAPEDGAWGGVDTASGGLGQAVATGPLTYREILGLLLDKKLVAADGEMLVSPDLWRVMISQLSMAELQLLAGNAPNFVEGPISRLPEVLRAPVLEAWADKKAPLLLVEHRGFRAAIDAVSQDSGNYGDSDMRAALLARLVSDQRDIELLDQHSQQQAGQR